ncbi:hypothetical protein [Serratia sp. AKBS12]|uniref:hypothetical protein n=1 Tax=Serratia sp. AKBS12 TaxID=2974597 RepID=UPI002166B533|nr:hypothetical protein [Serratia sp. AKBS12]MCS3407935.1 hypothetical protein [Serratia sp. AKBS12]HEI8866371.1 hypothetical protein [Serratia odorifera]
MSYNQKVWLGVVLFCTLFWLAVIQSVHTLGERLSQQSAQQSGQMAKAAINPHAKNPHTIATDSMRNNAHFNVKA